jgi:F-type H+-transporting ATPase subunit b
MHLLIADGGFGGLFAALGLNWQAFLLNAAAFLVTAWVVGKYVWPPLTKALDNKKGELEAATKLAGEAQNKLQAAQVTAQEVVAKARETANEILAAARDEATEQMEAAREKAAAQAERLVAEAREQLSRDVDVARRELKTDTSRLVAQATETILREKLDAKHDAALIGRTLEEVYRWPRVYKWQR